MSGDRISRSEEPEYVVHIKAGLYKVPNIDIGEYGRGRSARQIIFRMTASEDDDAFDNAMKIVYGEEALEMMAAAGNIRTTNTLEVDKNTTLSHEMVNAVLEVTAREMVPDSIESMVRHDAEQSFESFLVNDLFKKRDQDPNWFPTPTEKTAHRVYYNLRHRRTETVQKKYEKALSAKVDEARDNLEDNLAHVGQSLLVALEHGIDGHSFLAFDQGRIVPRKDIQLDDPIPMDDAEHAVTGIGSPERPHKDTVNDEGVPDIDEVRRGEQEMEKINTARSRLELGTEGVNDV